MRLLLTGYSDLAAIVGSVNESEVFRFVSKPWQEEDLRATIAEAVDVAIALEAAAAGPPPALPPNAAVLVLGDAALARAARELAKNAYKVHEAAEHRRGAGNARGARKSPPWSATSTWRQRPRGAAAHPEEAVAADAADRRSRPPRTPN